MRIKKNKPVVSSEVQVDVVPETVVEFATEPSSVSLDSNKYAEAIGYINSAISSLSVHAKEDSLAKESIANLSVVLLDLKN